MGIRRKNLVRGSSIGEETFRVDFAALIADAAHSIFIPDCEKVEIRELGGFIDTDVGTDTLALSIRTGNDAIDPDDGTAGTEAVAADATYLLDTADEAKVKRFGEPTEVLAVAQTIVDTTKKGLYLMLFLDITGTDGLHGSAWFKYVVWRQADL